MDDISKLKEKWNANKEDYKLKEVGSGIHSFIKDALLSDKLFNLKETVRNTKKNLTFVHDTEADKNGRPDFILYIDENITIVCEVKCYGNIKSGEEQILRYQSGYNKQYGILTDGYEWRFYNGNSYRVITIEEIFEDNKKFITLWSEFKSQEYYYLELFDDKNNIAFRVEDEKELFFNSITSLIYNFKTKLNLAGYFVNDKDKDKKATEISYAYIIQFILYKTLIDNSYIDFNDDFKDRLDVISKNLKFGDTAYINILNNIKSISFMISKKLYRPFKKEQEFINEKLESIMSKPKAMLSDISLWLDIILFIKRFDFSNVKNDIFGFIYENYLKELYEDKDKGQYFTDPELVDFMLNEMGYTINNIKKLDEDKISIIDPSCGAGTFLYNAVSRIIDAFFDGSESNAKYIEKLINENIFGLDISEFPLYLAEMSILMRMLPIIINEKYNNPLDKKIQLFKTNDSISEFINTDIMDNSNIEKDNGQYFINYEEDLSLGYSSYIRDEEDLKDLKISISPLSFSRRRFDYVIGNPPYISYNNCITQKMLFTQLMNKNNKKIYMNNIYGVNLHSAPGNKKNYPPRPNLYAFFVALGIGLLKKDGKLCYIIPQTILTEPNYDVLRYHLSKFTSIEKIIIFNLKMFIGRGIKQKKTISTSSLIIVLQNKLPNKNHKVKIIKYYKKDNIINIGKYLKSNSKNVKSIEQKELIDNYNNWNFINLDNRFKEFIRLYNESSEDFSNYYNHSSSNMRFKSKFYFDAGYELLKDKYSYSSINDYYQLININNNEYKVSLKNIYYPNNKEYIKVPEGSQGIDNILSNRYFILWKKAYSNYSNFCFIDSKNTKIIFDTSIQCIASNNKNELLYIMALLNSFMNKNIYNSLFKLSNEKVGIFKAISRIKQFIRIPKISASNLYIKNEIITQMENILKLENIYLKDIINFNSIQMQKFDNIYLKNNNLILEYKGNEIKLKIKSNLLDTINNNIDSYIKNNKKNILTSDLKMIKIINYDKQNELKEYLDYLVFILYFSIPIKNIGIENIDYIKKICNNNDNFLYIKSL